MQRRLDPNGGSAALEYAELEPDVVMQVPACMLSLHWHGQRAAMPSFLLMRLGAVDLVVTIA